MENLNTATAEYSVSLSFEGVSLPPFEDILILGKKCPHGKIGVTACLQLLAPDDFELVELDNDHVEALLISKRLLKRMPQAEIVRILQDCVFPRISKGEVVKVDFKVRVFYQNITGRLEGV
jgi:hypothetical protein